jgi:hypothetical protein
VSTTKDHTIEYTRTAVAFPHALMGDRGRRRGEVDSLNIHDDRGEFVIRFIDLPTIGVVPKLEVFGDGLEVFCDPRVQRTIRRWRRAEQRGEQVTIQSFIVWLEAEGCVPSRYQLDGVKRVVKA